MPQLPLGWFTSIYPSHFLIISSKHQARKVQDNPLHIGSHSIMPSRTAKSLGAVIDSHLSMDSHISSICKTAYFHLRNIGRLRRYLDREALECVVHAFITTKLDYCNSLLHGIPTTQLNRLQSIQNTAARILTGTSRYDNITPVLRALHWLPVQQRIKFKIMVLVYKSINNMAPCYLCDLLQVHVPLRSLRSGDQNLLTVPFTTSSITINRAFSVAGPRLWNNLPYAIRSSSSLNVFKSNLKTHLFREYYD